MLAWFQSYIFHARHVSVDYYQRLHAVSPKKWYRRRFQSDVCRSTRIDLEDKNPERLNTGASGRHAQCHGGLVYLCNLRFSASLRWFILFKYQLPYSRSLCSGCDLACRLPARFLNGTVNLRSAEDQSKHTRLVEALISPAV